MAKQNWIVITWIEIGVGLKTKSLHENPTPAEGGQELKTLPAL